MLSSANTLPTPPGFNSRKRTPESGAGPSAPPTDERDRAPNTRFIVERRTRGLLWSERLGCALATLVACTPPLLFGNWMLPMLKQESGFALLLLTIAIVLGTCASIFLGIAISVFVWWIPRLAYLSIHTKVRRTGVRAGVRSRGIWIAGIGWLPWSGLHIRDKSIKTGLGRPCTAIVIKTPQYGDLVLHSAEHAPELLAQIRRYMEYQKTEFPNTEFQNTEILPYAESDGGTERHRPRAPAARPKGAPAQEHSPSSPEFQATEIMSYDLPDLAQNSEPPRG
jgi:hypothetical protein